MVSLSNYAFIGKDYVESLGYNTATKFLSDIQSDSEVNQW